MTEEFKWAKALRISPQQVMEWQDIAPSDVPLLFWCLSEGHITSAEYLEWAINYFQLPVLQDEFFKEFPPFEKNPPGEWHPWLKPVAEWDGILYVACVEPPESGRWPQPVQFLLASPLAMQQAWNSPEKTLVIEMPEGLSAAPTKKKTLLQLDEGVDLEVTNTTNKRPIETAPPEITKSGVTQSGVTKTSLTGTMPSLTLGKSKLPVPPKTLADAQTPEHAIAWAFDQLKAHYTHAMALQESDNVMNPLFWTPNWKAPKDLTKTRATSLDQPSLFRIAGKTMRPYHGFVVSSDIHKEFFKAWGFEELPACATVVPVVVGEQVWGLLLSVGEEIAQGPEPLKVAESVGEKLAQFLASQIAAA